MCTRARQARQRQRRGHGAPERERGDGEGWGRREVDGTARGIRGREKVEGIRKEKGIVKGREEVAKKDKRREDGMEQLKPKGGEGNGFEKWKEMLDGVSDAGRKKNWERGY